MSELSQQAFRIPSPNLLILRFHQANEGVVKMITHFRLAVISI
jgi:hypothetical protein